MTTTRAKLPIQRARRPNRRTSNAGGRRRYGLQSGSGHIVPGQQPYGQAGLSPVAWVRGWNLWTHTSRAGLAWIVLCEAVVLAWSVWACIASGWPAELAWRHFAALAVAAAVYLAFTRPAEERRRARHLASEHVDHAGLWNVAAALVLPAPLVIVMVLAIRAHRYTIARKPPVQVVFGTTGILAGALTAQAISSTAPTHPWLVGGGLDPASVLAQVCNAIAALSCYYLVQTVVLGIARGFRFRRWEWVPTVGTRQENIDLLRTLCLGLVAAALAGVAFGLLLAAVAAVAVGYTRHTQLIESLTRDRDRFKTDAQQDPLTGLLNRSGYGPAAEAAVAFAGATLAHRGLAVAVIDIDFFKRVNDCHGHHNGDLVLRAVAGLLRTETRPTDICGRQGGEEFALIWTDTSPPEALEIAERIRHSVESLTVPATHTRGGTPYDITNLSVSIGVSMFGTHGRSLEELQRIADAALYRAKETGRNQVVSADALEDQEPATQSTTTHPRSPSTDACPPGASNQDQQPRRDQLITPKS